MDNGKKRLWHRLRAAGLGLVALAFVAGIVFWGSFNTAMEMTNREEFCISCHEMEDNVYKEYRSTIHYSNRSGVRATCPDCHVPKDWTHKIIRKIQASNEVLHKVLGTINTPEKFNAKRLELAKHEWERMKKTDSRECRNCHDYQYFDYNVQGRRANKMHEEGLGNGKTCIDCHKGIAHTLPAVEQEIGTDKGGATQEEFHPPAAQ
jgi:cytochrome c-type protein NapC